MLLTEWLRRCCEITDGPVFFTFNEKWTGAVERAIEEYDLRLHQRCYWRFTFGQNCKVRYTPSVRPVYWLNDATIYPDAIKVPSARQAKYGDKRAKAGGRLPDNMTDIEIDINDPAWQFSRVCGTFKEKRHWHLCQIPELMMRRVILGHSKEGDTVFDPFSGSGSTCYQALENGRNFVGLDCCQNYLDETVKEIGRRIEDGRIK